MSSSAAASAGFGGAAAVSSALGGAGATLGGSSAISGVLAGAVAALVPWLTGATGPIKVRVASSCFEVSPSLNFKKHLRANEFWPLTWQVLFGAQQRGVV